MRGAGLTTRISGRVTSCKAASLTLKVGLYVPDVVGVPDITPVLAFNWRPGAMLPEVSLHVYGGNPPDAVSATEKPAPSVASGKLAVVISRGY